MGHGAGHTAMGMYVRPSEEDILAFGGMREVVVRSSQRLREQPNAELPQLDRAMDLTSRKVYGSPSGTPAHAKLSLCSLSHSEVKRRSLKLGILLGNTNEQVDNSISTIMEVERERGVIFLKNSLPSKNVETESSLALKKAINICEDLVDEEVEVSDDHADLNETLASIRGKGKKKTLSKRAIRRGVRLALYSKF